MSLRLEARHLTKRFGSFTAVGDVTLDFAPGKIHAVLGENGAGKSTLMKLLFGLFTPTSGEIYVDGHLVVWHSSMDAIRAGLGMVQQHFTLVETLSAIDNIMLGAEVCSHSGHLHRDEAIARLEKLLPSAQLSVEWHALVSELTVGQKQRLEILKLLFRESQILFLDEPTAVLTPAEIEDFFSILLKLRDAGRTIVLITHKINEVLQVCDTYSVLRQGELKARGQVAGASVGEIVESMIGHKLPEFNFKRSDVSNDSVFLAKNLTAGTLKGVNLDVKRSEIVGIAGVEGSGQGQLVDSLMGLIPFTGDVQILNEKIESLQTAKVRRLGTGLVPEDRITQGLWLEESCFINMAIGLEDRFIKNELFQDEELKRSTAAWAHTFDVRTSSLSSAVGSLSGGNQQKVIFAREVGGRKPKFLICHQPTRGVDLGAINLIHRHLMELRNQGLGVLLISSELDELLKLCDRIYVFFNGEVAAEFSRDQFERMRIGQAMTGVKNAH